MRLGGKSTTKALLGLCALAAATLSGCADSDAPTGAPWPLPPPVIPPGAGGSGSGGQTSVGGQPPQIGLTAPGFTSDWGMVGFEDPVAISFGRHIGCYTGLPVGDHDLKDCGQLRIIQSDGVSHATVAMSFQNVSAGYAADLYVSNDGRRMAGAFVSYDDPTGAGKLPPIEDFRLGFAWAPLTHAVSDLDGPVLLPTYTRRTLPIPEYYATFQLTEDESSRGELVAGHAYAFAYREGPIVAIVSELGAFYDDELRWDDATQTLSAGPVQATRPGYPIALEVKLEAGKLHEAIATTDGGWRYRLTRIETVP
jgi:hypothetical protein